MWAHLDEALSNVFWDVSPTSWLTLLAGIRGSFLSDVLHHPKDILMLDFFLEGLKFADQASVRVSLTTFVV